MDLGHADLALSQIDLPDSAGDTKRILGTNCQFPKTLTVQQPGEPLSGSARVTDLGERCPPHFESFSALPATLSLT